MPTSVNGLDSILARLAQVEVNVHTQANAAIANAVNATFDESQTDCPVDTGELSNSGDFVIGDLSGSVTYGTDHCWYVELGTCKMSAQPFLYPAFLLACQQLASDCQGIQP